jgi:hypothetical protein
MSQHSLFIVPAQHKAWFDAQADALGNGGPALVMALSANGQEPATHGWCAVKLSEASDAAVAASMAANPDKGIVWRKYDVGSQPGYPDAVLSELGLKRIVKSII